MVVFSRFIVFPSQALSPEPSCFSHPHMVFLPIDVAFMISFYDLSPSLSVSLTSWYAPGCGCDSFWRQYQSCGWRARLRSRLFPCRFDCAGWCSVPQIPERSQTRHQTFFSCSAVMWLATEDINSAFPWISLNTPFRFVRILKTNVACKDTDIIVCTALYEWKRAAASSPSFCAHCDSVSRALAVCVLSG